MPIPLPLLILGVATTRPAALLSDLIGVNAFIDDPLEKILPVGGLVREYHPLGWDFEAADHKRRWQPSGAAGGNAWFFDDFYGKLANGGATVCPVVWQSPDHLFPGNRTEGKPILVGANAEDPQAYRVHAEHFFQIAARYGRRSVPDSDLDLGTGQLRKSGLGFLRYLEQWNEPDKTWETRAGRFEPNELAAMASDDYDGDQGRMGPKVGIKAADPAMKLVMGGLAGLDLDYVKGMKAWADQHRGGSFPADVLNFHHYSSTGNEQGFKPDGQGISPEADHLREKMASLVQWRNQNLPRTEVWLSEYGYDTHPKSPLHAPKIGSLDGEHVQAAWLLRSVLALAAAGVDRSAMFMLRDTDSQGAGVFATCGLVTQKGEWRPKPSWTYLATFRRAMGSYRFDRIVQPETRPVAVYAFRTDLGKRAFAVWCPSSEDRRVVNYRLAVTGKRVRVVTFRDDSVGGEVRPVPPAKGAVFLTVTETPTLVIQD